MERKQVESGQIKSVGYDPGTLMLEVEFKGGSVYEYQGLLPETYDDFMKAESKGKFFGSVIKSDTTRYPFKKIRGTDLEEAKKKVAAAAEFAGLEATIHQSPDLTPGVERTPFYNSPSYSGAFLPLVILGEMETVPPGFKFWGIVHPREGAEGKTCLIAIRDGYELMASPF